MQSREGQASFLAWMKMSLVLREISPVPSRLLRRRGLVREPPRPRFSPCLSPPPPLAAGCCFGAGSARVLLEYSSSNLNFEELMEFELSE